jgi:ABC-type transport system involved in multi-copper enzyme maturation permease subunit
MYAEHGGEITEAYLREAADTARDLPDPNDPEAWFTMTEEDRKEQIWLEDLKRKLERFGLPSYEELLWDPERTEPLLPEGYGPVLYADTDGWELYMKLQSGIGAVVSLILPCFLLSPLLNGEVASGMRRVILTIAGSEKSQIRAKWCAALTVAAASAVLTELLPLLGTALCTGLTSPDLPVGNLGLGLENGWTIGQLFLLRFSLLFLGTLVASGLTAGFSGMISQTVGSMVAVLALFLVPLLPLPEEAPHWVVEAQKFGPAGFFTGDILYSSTVKLAAFCLFWIVASAVLAHTGRIVFRTMKIPEEFYRN